LTIKRGVIFSNNDFLTFSLSLSLRTFIWITAPKILSCFNSPHTRYWKWPHKPINYRQEFSSCSYWHNFYASLHLWKWLIHNEGVYLFKIYIASRSCISNSTLVCDIRLIGHQQNMWLNLRDLGYTQELFGYDWGFLSDPFIMISTCQLRQKDIMSDK